MSSITVKDGTEIYYKDWGTGQPIMFHHGWPLSADDWDSQMLFFLLHCAVRRLRPAGRQALEERHVEGLSGPAARDADHACRSDQCRSARIHKVVNANYSASQRYLFLWFAEYLADIRPWLFRCRQMAAVLHRRSFPKTWRTQASAVVDGKPCRDNNGITFVSSVMFTGHK
jgi:pimeloyl-ACP methyl ester carboxylesterase